MRHSLSPPLSFLHPGGRGLDARSSKRGTMRAISWLDRVLSSLSALDVNLASVTDSRHLRQHFCVVDGIHQAVVTHTNAPLVITAPELFAPRRTRIGCKKLR